MGFADIKIGFRPGVNMYAIVDVWNAASISEALEWLAAMRPESFKECTVVYEL